VTSDFGLSDTNRLAADLTELSNVIYAEVKKSMQQTAMETKKVHQKEARKGPGGKRYAPTIDYEVEGIGAGNGRAGGVISAVVGPNLERYGGKTGKGGLVPSLGFLDDPQATGDMTVVPSRARRVAERFAGDELERRLRIAVDESARRLNL
jgi:hypothetical protein